MISNFLFRVFESCSVVWRQGVYEARQATTARSSPSTLGTDHSFP